MGTWSNGSPRYRHEWVLKTDDEKTNLCAYVCVSARVGGKPRQKAIYLASIRCEYLGQVGHQAYFWQHALSRLDALALSSEQQQSLEAALAQRVARPSNKEIARNEAEFQAFMQSIS
jgi:cation transport regulator ChaC